MKHLILTLVFLGSISSVFAHELTCTDENISSDIVDTVQNNRINNIIKAPCVLSTISQLENNRDVDCMQPKEKQIQWRCMGAGPSSGCGFMLDITCVSRMGTFSTNNKIIRLSLSGRETNAGVVFQSEYTRLTEYETLKEKQ